MKQKKEASKEYQEYDKLSLEEINKKVNEVDTNTYNAILNSESSDALLIRDLKYWDSDYIKRQSDSLNIYRKTISFLNNGLKNEWPNTVMNPSKEETKLSIDVDWWIPEMECGVIFQSGLHHREQPFLRSKAACKELLEEMEQEMLSQETEEDALFVEYCINTWTKDDVEVRHIIRDEDLKVIEVFDLYNGCSLNYIIKSIYDRINDLHVEYTEKELKYEVEFLKKDKEGVCKNTGNRNKNVKYFLQDQFYKTEKKMYHDPEVKFYLDRNRQRYQFTLMEDLSTNQLLGGFKITGAHFGYSFFNPRLFVWFIVNQNMEGKVCYDPTGGWGHRMIGSQLLSKYIYNDLSHSTVEGVKEMAKFHNITNTVFYENDARIFEPIEDYDCMFTCVPYYADNRNTEVYECDGFTSQEDYNDFIYKLFEKYEKKESCKVFGLVIREDMLPNDLKEKCVEQHPLKLNKSHFQYYSPKQKTEYLYIFKKVE